VLINGILDGVDDLDVRVHYRSQMEASGLGRIIKICSSFGVPSVDKQLDILKATLKDDESRLRERIDSAILHDLGNIDELYSSLRLKTDGTQASRYFLSMLQHLLLIDEEGPSLAHHYKLIDSLVTDLVLDKKLGSAEQRLGHSVERVVALFSEADRTQQAEQAAADARAQVLQLKMEKEVLEQEIAQGHDGLVGQLKERSIHLEQQLKVTRETTSKLQGQLETQRDGYEERIRQLENQISELFRLLRDSVDHGGNLEQQQNLVSALEKQLQRSETINILEGRSPIRPLPESQTMARMFRGSSGKFNQHPSEPEFTAGRTSQFMDADDAAIQDQIPQQLQLGVNIVRDFSDLISHGCTHRITVCQKGRAFVEFSQCEALTTSRRRIGFESTSDTTSRRVSGEWRRQARV
jgi:cytokinesis protein